jgi:hypothetical protein
MSAEELLDMTSTPMAAITDLRAIRDKIHEEFDAATSSEQRGALLGMFKAAMDIAESHVAKNGTAEQLAELQKARTQDYSLFIVKECLVGLDSPGGGDVSVEMLKTVTDREVAAGRMTEDHNLRKGAVEGSAAPHLTHAELLAKHAQLKTEGSKAAAPKTTPGSAKAYAFGAVLGKKLKGIFGK